jgi:maleylacetoacetate isomerase/maleylpyruvate isomerase
VETGLEAVERQLAAAPSHFCHGDTPTLADCVLVPQIFNAQRFDCRLDHVPQVMRVFERCMALPAFEATQPSRCPDAEPA